MHSRGGFQPARTGKIACKIANNNAPIDTGNSVCNNVCNSVCNNVCNSVCNSVSTCLLLVVQICNTVAGLQQCDKSATVAIWQQCCKVATV
jgi:hypothetical protein